MGSKALGLLEPGLSLSHKGGHISNTTYFLKEGKVVAVPLSACEALLKDIFGTYCYQMARKKHKEKLMACSKVTKKLIKRHMSRMKVLTI